MIDFHAHLLPNMDDGSNGTVESIAMLKALKKQNIDTVVVTPHFYREQNDVESFLKRRQISFDKLNSALKDEENLPDIVLGAEVTFFNELYKMDDLESLSIGNSQYILIELPYEKWGKRTYDGIYSLISNRFMKPVIAHVDRYFGVQQDMKKFQQLAELGVIMQINSDYVNGFFSGRKAINMYKAGYAHLLGSDCHNMTNRPPTIGAAYKKIESILGKNQLEIMDRLGRKILG